MFLLAKMEGRCQAGGRSTNYRATTSNLVPSHTLSSLILIELSLLASAPMTIIDKPKFEPASGDSPATAPSTDLPEHPSNGESSTKSSSTPSVSNQLPGKPLTPPVGSSSDLFLKKDIAGAPGNPVKRVLGAKRKFSGSSAAAVEVQEPRPILELAGPTEEPNYSQMSKKLRLLESIGAATIRTLVPPGTSSTSTGTKAIHVNIRPMIGEQFVVSISDDSCLFELKGIISERTGLTLGSIVLSLPGDGRMLTDDEQTLMAIGLTEGSSLNLTVKVSSGMEPANTFDLDFGDEDASDEFYDVIYPIGSGESSLSPGAQETLADFVKLLEGAPGTSSAPSDGNSSRADPSESGTSLPSLPPGTKVIEISIPGSYAKISRLLDGMPRPSAPDPIDSLDELKISNEEDEDQYHEELIKSALGPRGASIFQSPTLSPVSDAPPASTAAESSLTGQSCCFQCGKKCRLTQRYECKCKRTFCPQHRYYDQHNCTFDFKAQDKEKVERANPKVVKAKIDKI